MTVHHFFSEPVGVYGNAYLNWTSKPTEELTAYAHSYRCAAMRLVAHFDRRDIGTIDESALPILFLYRHSVELYLKAIAYVAAVATINDNELEFAIPRLWREHSLIALAKLASPTIGMHSRHLLAKNGDLERTVIALAEKIDAIDPGSYSFRYPVTSRGQSALPSSFFVNIFTFSTYVEAALDDIVQFCRALKDEQSQVQGQMKIALHGPKSS